MNPHDKFQQLQQEYMKIQQDHAKLIDIKAENELVKKDLQNFPEDTKLYKMTGPAMIPKTMEEVKQAIDDKIVFVNKQLEQLKVQMRAKETEIIEANKQRVALMKQQQMQQQQNQTKDK